MPRVKTFVNGGRIFADDLNSIQDDYASQVAGLTPQLWQPGDLRFTARAALDTGWLWADGALISRATFAALFAAIGTAYGAGDGSTTFALPDCRGRVPYGADNMGQGAAGRLTANATRGSSGGEEKHTLITAEMPSHTHAPSPNNGQMAQSSSAGTSVSPVTGIALGGAARAHDFGNPFTSSVLSLANTGGDGAHNNMQPGACCFVWVKT